MSVKISRLPGGGYRVTTPHGTHAKRTTLAKAQAQRRIINAAERGVTFTKRKRKRSH